MTINEIQNKYGQTWTTEQLQADFNVEGFCFGYVVARLKESGVRGSLSFQHRPRVYHSWVSYD